MPQPSYPYACARISALEKGLLSAQTIRRMAEGTTEDAVRYLLDARYGNLPDATSEDAERMIENVRRQTAQTVRELSPDPKLTDLFLLQTDAQNLKLLLKARLLGIGDALFLEGGLFSREALGAMVAEQKYDALPEEMRDSLVELERRLKIQTEPQLVSLLVDYGYYAHCLNASNGCKEPFVRQYFEAMLPVAQNNCERAVIADTLAQLCALSGDLAGQRRYLSQVAKSGNLAIAARAAAQLENRAAARRQQALHMVFRTGHQVQIESL